MDTRRKPCIVAAAMLAVMFALVSAGCAGGTRASGGTGGVTAGPALGDLVSPASQAASSPGATPEPAAGAAQDSPGDGCLTANLRVSAVNLDSSAGHSYKQIILTNAGAASCVLGGFPGVSYVDAGGRQLGAAADRTGGPGTAIMLLPGQHAASLLIMIRTGIQAGCDEPNQTAEAVALRIYPPANRTALPLPVGVPETVCASPAVHQLQISALTR
ncbi:DUF4232 domain-containing protein [Frankia sp. Cj3]|uniref:DUF4232 domain-containing protein n=1 Tax=Frankia sp. Cj3 TaxID=2880976 RepID=UPI001EF4B4B5|nr:DUF4232 domain-containing protein [Frankia sp. Cj3]